MCLQKFCIQFPQFYIFDCVSEHTIFCSDVVERSIHANFSIDTTKELPFQLFTAQLNSVTQLPIVFLIKPIIKALFQFLVLFLCCQDHQIGIPSWFLQSTSYCDLWLSIELCSDISCDLFILLNCGSFGVSFFRFTGLLDNCNLSTLKVSFSLWLPAMHTGCTVELLSEPGGHVEER